ncbi:MAG TPA: hypothetical protein VIV12_15920, partial [Streptosporangiaceae bacterium]
AAGGAAGPGVPGGGRLGRRRAGASTTAGPSPSRLPGRGLQLAFDDELLWRDLLLAAHATRHEGLLRNAVEEVRARAALGDGFPRMTPETEALIDELLPSWRSSIA